MLASSCRSTRREPLLEPPAPHVARFLAPLPADRSILTLEELARRALAGRGSFACVGVEGSGSALVAHRLARVGAARVVCVCADAEVAQRTASDLSAFARGLGFARLWLRGSTRSGLTRHHLAIFFRPL